MPPRRSSDRPPRREKPALAIAGRAWWRGRLRPIEVGLDPDGTIVEVARSVAADERHDLGDRVLLPAAVDPHVHFREPGGDAAAETLISGSIGAARGGVAVVGDMPNNRPVIDDTDSFASKVSLTRGRSAVDLVLYAALTPKSDVERLGRVAGGFKLFLSPTTGVDRAEEAVDDSFPASRFEAVAPTGLPLIVHAEDPRKFSVGRAPGNAAEWDASRPEAAEISAIRSLAPAPSSLRLHIAHTTTDRAATEAESISASFEVTPHHLLLSARTGDGPRSKVNPPLRSEAERERLWARFVSGRVPMLASDHAPHSLAEKARPFAVAPSGMPGVETALPLLLERVRSGDLSLGVLQAAACDRPARFLGLPLGRLAPGHRGDLLAVDFRRRRPIRARELASPCGWTPFEGREAVYPEYHYRRGARIVEDGEFVGRMDGSVLRPEYGRPGADRLTVETV